MKLIKVVPLSLFLLLFITACADVEKDNGIVENRSIDLPSDINNSLPGDTNTNTPPEENGTSPIVDDHATYDLKEYFPRTAKRVECQLSTTDLNLNTTIVYGGSEDNLSVSSDHDGLDLFEYTQMDAYMHMDTQRESRRTSVWFDDRFVNLKRENNETNVVLRYFEENDTIIFSTTFEYIGNFTVSSGSGQGTYSDAYESDSLWCSAKGLGDYNISDILYADALELDCIANHSKGGTINSTVVTVYNDDFNSSTIFLPEIGVVSVDYSSRDMNFSVRCQP